GVGDDAEFQQAGGSEQILDLLQALLVVRPAWDAHFHAVLADRTDLDVLAPGRVDAPLDRGGKVVKRIALGPAVVIDLVNQERPAVPAEVGPAANPQAGGEG